MNSERIWKPEGDSVALPGAGLDELEAPEVVGEQVWRISQPLTVKKRQDFLNQVEYLYVSNGNFSKIQYFPIFVQNSRHFLLLW